MTTHPLIHSHRAGDNPGGTRVTSDLDHDGDLFLRQRLAASFATAISRASTR